MFVKKRKAFDSTAMRTDGAVNARQVAKKDTNPGQAKLRGGKPMPKWKQQSQAFRASMQASRITDTNSAEYEKAAAAASQYNDQSLEKC